MIFYSPLSYYLFHLRYCEFWVLINSNYLEIWIIYLYVLEQLPLSNVYVTPKNDNKNRNHTNDSNDRQNCRMNTIKNIKNYDTINRLAIIRNVYCTAERLISAFIVLLWPVLINNIEFPRRRIHNIIIHYRFICYQ